MIVSTRYGQLRGVAGEGITTWRGVPFAAPPTRELRWAAPREPEPWSDVRDATEHGAAPVQPVEPGQGMPGATSYGEDCLFANVCAPDHGTGHPVLVAIPGGGFRTGHGAMMGDGDRFARAGIVVVTVNYRLGALGLAALPGAPDAGVGSVLDQIAALRWVRDNIAAFGGDPARVTVYGESAGGKSVGNLMASPAARGLFAQAVVSSGGADHVAAPATGAAVAARLCAELGSTDLDELRRIPAEDVLAAQEQILTGIAATWLWRPTLHADVLPRLPRDEIEAGSSAGVRLMIGANSNEAALFAALGGPAATVPTESVLSGILGETGAANLLATYRRSRGVDEAGARVAAMGDERYGIPTLRLADAQVLHAPVHRYRIDIAAPGFPAQLDGGHATELPMVWDVALPLPGGRAPAPGPEREATARRVHDAWTSFVTTGTPTVEGTDWPAYDLRTRPTMIFGEKTRVEDDPRRDEREAWGTASWTSSTWYPLPD